MKPEDILSDLGWYEGRKKDTSYMITDLKREGYHLPTGPLLAMIEKYWDLGGDFVLPDGTFENVSFNIDKGMGMGPKALETCGKIIGKPLIPVGTVHFGNCALIASNDPIFYLVAEGKVFQIGENVQEIIENLYFHHPLPLILTF